ncbi:MAG: large conductance mechanosensitive channel protein MscL [Candidatus Paceibacterota bacterium]
MKSGIQNVLKEFKTFILRGNVMDLAVGIIIGAAFTSIVNSLVKDIIMPPVGLLLRGVDFSDLYINLSSESFATFAEAQAAGVPTINYGLFINNLITFFITAVAVFFLVRAVNHLQSGVKKKLEVEEKQAKKESERVCPFCFEIVDKRATRCSHCTAELAVSHP